MKQKFSEKRLFAIRWAVQCLNTQNDIQTHTLALYDEILSKNELSEKDIVSVIFSVTKDLDAKNPATALRSQGRAETISLFVNQEAHFPGSMERLIRVLIHCYLDVLSTPVHVYQNGAELLRPDINN